MPDRAVGPFAGSETTMARRDDLTIEEALSDPMIRAVMRADRVDVEALRRSWGSLARTLRERSPARAARALPATWFEACTGRGRTDCTTSVAGA